MFGVDDLMVLAGAAASGAVASAIARYARQHYIADGARSEIRIQLPAGQKVQFTIAADADSAAIEQAATSALREASVPAAAHAEAAADR